MINVFQEGGIGDLILSVPLIEQVFKQDKYPIILHTFFPEIAKHLLPWINVNGDLYQANVSKKDWDYFISISDMVFFTKKPDAILPDFLQEMYKSWLSNHDEWKLIIKNHPTMANEMAKKSLNLGQTRWTFPFFFIGKEYKKFDYPYKLNDIKAPDKFITIHDGFDATNHYKFMRSTKSWDIEYWAEFIKLFKQKYPDIHVVQLGGIKHQKIKGVDINFAGQLSFEKSLEYLNSSLIHIDGDSGLVHARRLFNKQSIVLFGATNIDYFGYPENINIAPKYCGDCWWKNRDWMENCKEGHITPKCMDSILPIDVLNKINL